MLQTLLQALAGPRLCSTKTGGLDERLLVDIPAFAEAAWRPWSWQSPGRSAPPASALNLAGPLAPPAPGSLLAGERPGSSSLLHVGLAKDAGKAGGEVGHRVLTLHVLQDDRSKVTQSYSSRHDH